MRLGLVLDAPAGSGLLTEARLADRFGLDLIFIPELDRQPGDITIFKRQWGAFYGTDMDLQLRRRNLTTIIICGIATEIGVESTARDAFERGYYQIFAEDAMTSMAAEEHQIAITRIFPRIGLVRTTAEILSAI